jgi:diadenosine tetraphosphate (Ap4A) HIT family hydrolase
VPHVIPRDEAIARIEGLRGAQTCVVCALFEGRFGDPLVVARGERASVLLPRYAVRWGHALVAIHHHVEAFTELEDAAWLEASALALAAARAIEHELAPLRCYVASLGTARSDLPMTSPHLHLHVIPTYDPEDRPSAVLTWEHGVTVAEESEWSALLERLQHRIASTRG